MINRFVRRLVLPAAAACALALLSRPQAAAEGFASGLLLCTRSLLPALFPFFVVSALLTAAPGAELLARPLRPLARACGLTGADAALMLLLSWLGGYAVCARLAGDAVHAGRMDRDQAQRFWIVGCCSGPGFAIGCVGGLMLGSVRLGALLYGLQLAANFGAAAVLSLAGLLPRPGRQAQACPPAGGQGDAAGPPLSLPGAIGNAVDSSLTVCGCVLFFRVMGAVAESFLPEDAAAAAVLRGLLEVTAGCDAFAAIGGGAALRGVCLCLSLLGLSVFVQLRALAKLPLSPLLLSRGVHAVVLQGLVRLCAPALPGEWATYSSLSRRVVTAARMPPDAAFLLLCFLCAALYKAGRKLYNMR